MKINKNNKNIYMKRKKIIQNKETIKNKRIRLRKKILKKNLERMLTEMIRNGFTKAKKAEEDFKGG